MTKLPFGRVNAAALACLDRLVAEWLPGGKLVNGEWQALNPRRADGHTGSFSINTRTGVWADFATDDKGADPVSLYAYLFTSDGQGQACRALAERLGIEIQGANMATPPKTGTPPPEAEPKPEKPRTWWVPVLPAPEDAPALPRAHPVLGLPERVWTYRDAAGQVMGYVYRFRTSEGGKEVLPLVWARHVKSGKTEWRWLSWAEPRPLYGLDRLAARPEATVLLVEGEKCADVGGAELDDLVVVSWPGGGKAVDKIDWSPLHGRKVVQWPDCDAQREPLGKAEKAAGLVPEAKPILPAEKQPGIKAMDRIAVHLSSGQSKLWRMEIPAPGEKPSGWDIADAVEEGLRGAALADFIRARSRVYTPPPPPAESFSAPAQLGAPGCPSEEPGPPENQDDQWRRALLYDRGELKACLANVYDILGNDPIWAGVLAFDEFALRSVKLKPTPYGAEPGEWDQTDDSRTAMWLARKYRFTPSTALVAEAVEVLARANSVHPPRDWLRTLVWDGRPRLATWIARYLGAEQSEFTERVGAWFLMGMVARVMRPGSKFDYCLVLEGEQGKRKSSILAALGGPWFGDTDINLGDKDAMTALQGKWLHEFAELGSLARAEELRQKSFLSRQFDDYRPVYGRRFIRAPRQNVFAGSTNQWEWNKDPTGGRRFWPVEVMVDEIALDSFAAERDQLFAEALSRYEAGERYWPSKAEQKSIFDPVQLKREAAEPLVDALHDWVFEQYDASNHPKPFSAAQALMDGLGLKADKLTRDMSTRIGIALRKLGCGRIEKRNGMTRYWYVPPPKTETTQKSGQVDFTPAQPGMGGPRDCPF